MNLNSKNEKYVLIGAGIIALILISKVSNAFNSAVGGIGDIFGAGPEAKAAESAVNQAQTTVSPFKPQFLVKVVRENPGKTIHYLKAEYKTKFADVIYNAAGKWSGGVIIGTLTGRQPEDIVDVFNQINYQSQVSDLATYFQQKYGKDLLSYIVQGLSNNQPLSQVDNNKIINTIMARVGSLPKF